MKALLPLCALLFATVSAPASAAPDKVPPRVEIKYRVSMGSMKIGEGLDVFEHDGKTYSVVSESKTAGIAAVVYRLNIRRESKGSVTAAGLRPQSFVELRNGQPKRSASFDWSAHQAQLVDGDNKQTVQLPANTWDATSFAWNFPFSRPDGKELQVYVTDGRRITEYKYAILGRETLATPLGDLQTLHVKKIQDADDKRAFDVWLAVDQHYIPVRIRATEKDGTAFDSLVESIDLASKP
jgi:Protein of unknown function (DUF3108)